MTESNNIYFPRIHQSNPRIVRPVAVNQSAALFADSRRRDVNTGREIALMGDHCGSFTAQCLWSNLYSFCLARSYRCSPPPSEILRQTETIPWSHASVRRTSYGKVIFGVLACELSFLHERSIWYVRPWPLNLDDKANPRWSGILPE